jgi:hypothetical protein
MRKSDGFVLTLLLSLAALWGCSHTVEVQVPPRVELQGYGTLGLVQFASNSNPAINEQTTREFEAHIHSAQPGTRIVELGNSYAAKGIGVIAINANDPKVAEEDSYDMMQQRAKERGIQYPYVVDATSNLARAFGATKTPEAFLFDKDGKLVYHGAIDDNGQEPSKVENAYLKNALEAVLMGQSVAVKETKSIGCGIKFRS